MEDLTYTFDYKCDECNFTYHSRTHYANIDVKRVKSGKRISGNETNNRINIKTTIVKTYNEHQ